MTIRSQPNSSVATSSEKQTFWFWQTCFSLCSLLLCFGCNSTKPPVAEKPNPAAVENKDSANEAQVAKDNSEKEQPEKDNLAKDQLEETEASKPEPELTKEPTVPQTWSVQRVVAVAASGPIVLDISVNIDGHSLDEAAAQATSFAIASIEKDLKRPWTWDQLLEHPLIQSGWLGNLVPDEDQQAQVIAMYNTNAGEEVEETELSAFLSRGLTRSSALRFTDIGRSPETFPSNSPWQQLDLNQDTVLDKSEIAAITNTLARFDVNSDRTLSIAELRSDSMSGPGGMNSSSGDMMINKTAFAIHPTQNPSQSAAGLLEKYTMFGSVARDDWPNWTDEEWKAFDSDSDGRITASELERIVSSPPHFEVKIQFRQATTASDKAADSGASVSAVIAPKQKFEWTSKRNSSGQIAGPDFWLAATIDDSFSAANRAMLRPQLAAALTNPQLAAGFRTQLQLGEDAFKVLDANSDSQLSDEEFENAWQWLTAMRGSQVLARWMTTEAAWFQIADVDADNRLTEMELQKLPDLLSKLDKDRDGTLAPAELPATLRLEVARTDRRLNLNLPPSDMAQTNATDWFTASDTNSDGVIGSLEFLGSVEDFRSYDTDNDGFISNQEAYKVRATEVQ